MNVPNRLTLLRVFFSMAVFYYIAVGNYDWSLFFFLLAALTDFVDGWWARRFKQITVFGRIMDPFADKFLICGVFICLVAVPSLGVSPNTDIVPNWMMLHPWMAVVIVARELLITSLRAVVESSGGDFSAKWIGKWKMGFQCVAIVACFLYMSGGAQLAVSLMEGDASIGAMLVSDFHATAKTASSPLADCLDSCFAKTWRNVVFHTMIVSLWLTLGITIYSGVSYCFNAAKFIASQPESKNS